MKRWIGCLRVALATALVPALATALAPVLAVPACAEAPVAQAAPTPPLVPADFTVPILVEGPGFKLVPLGPDLVQIDYDAYMSSIEHLQQTFSRSTAWPHAGISDADAMLDMRTEQGRWQRRESFAYSVLTPDGSRERGSVYVQPSKVPGYDAVVRLWVTKADYDKGFDAQLYRFVQGWIARNWPFRKVAYPGRAIDWATWDRLSAQAAP